jgi:hypothetical protein
MSRNPILKEMDPLFVLIIVLAVDAIAVRSEHQISGKSEPFGIGLNNRTIKLSSPDKCFDKPFGSHRKPSDYRVAGKKSGGKMNPDVTQQADTHRYSLLGKLLFLY